MFQPWRIKLREAEVAFRNGRIEEAGELLRKHNLGEFRPGKRLRAAIAKQMAAKAKLSAGQGDTTAGWRNLQGAADFDQHHPEVDRLRDEFSNHAVEKATQEIEAGDAAEACARLDRLLARNPNCERAERLRRIAARMARVDDLEAHGKFAEAIAELAKVETMCPQLQRLADRRKQCSLNADKCRELEAALYGAVEQGEWQDTLAVADEILAIAPAHPAARSARRKAWRRVGMTVSQASGDQRPHKRGSTHRGISSPERDTVTGRQPGKRMLMWIDAVGGFLICLGDEIVLGPPTYDDVDIPILADISRRHAVIRRDGEGYMLEPGRDVKLDGRPLTGITSLVDGNVIELGQGVQLRFRTPHALSSTARLEMVSSHRTEPAVDGVLLMAESCVLGPAWHNHVVCRNWERDIVLSRRGEELICRSIEPMNVDGEAASGPVTLSENARIDGEDFAFSVEAI